MVGSVACGFASSFWALLACRVVMGAGEASIITLTGPFIDDVAPPAQKTLWFGILNVVRACLSTFTEPSCDHLRGQITACSFAGGKSHL